MPLSFSLWRWPLVLEELRKTSVSEGSKNFAQSGGGGGSTWNRSNAFPLAVPRSVTALPPRKKGTRNTSNNGWYAACCALFLSCHTSSYTLR